MAKTKKTPAYLGNQKLSTIIVGLVAVLVGVVLGMAIDNWHESSYEIGESEGYKDAAVRGTHSSVVTPGENKDKQTQNSNLNQNSTLKMNPVQR